VHAVLDHTIIIDVVASRYLTERPVFCI